MPTLAEDILMKGSIQYTSVFCFCFFTLFFQNETDTYSGVNIDLKVVKPKNIERIFPY